MDYATKRYLQQGSTPQVPCSANEPWSLWLNGTKLINHWQEKVYSQVYKEEILEYWKKKNKFGEARDINWKALHTALEESPQYMQWFITKHATGMCGVGKFMLRWKERDTDSCPRCGEREDAKHVWHCPSRNNLQIWSKELENLQEW